MAEKTPITIVQELCMRRHSLAPFYELIADGTENESKIFTYSVKAFEQEAIGHGKSKKDAKHEAAINLLTILKNIPEYQSSLLGMSDFKALPRLECSDGRDAIGQLLDICVSRDWPLATFTVQQACGAPHSPSFTVECRIASLVRIGNFSTKKGAKQIAAQEMLDVIQRMYANESSMEGQSSQIATMTDVPASKHVQTYRELKKSDVKTYLGIKLCDRHRFFQNLKPEQKAKIREVFDMCDSAEEKVALMCRSLHWEYRISPVVGHRLGPVKLFELLGTNFDMVISGLEPALYDEIIDYVSIMSGIPCAKM